jgi:two-component system, chemotaxis family, CheB/CheR fusion protein
VEGHAGPQAPSGTTPQPDIEEVARLRAELLATREYLQSLVRDHQATADDLAGVNEELVAANEELQSTNEELQSAKEELQSTNEELSTLNEELRTRNNQLDQIASDLENVLASVDIPVIIVDMALRVRRFTPTMHKIATFIPEDVGRPIDDLRLKVKVEDVPERILGVIHDLVAREWDVEGPEGRWYRMQIRPYRTTDRRLDGAVLAFVDVDSLKRALRDAESARDYAKSIVDTVATALIVIDDDLKIVSANNAFHRLFGLSSSEIEGASFLGIGGAWGGDGVHGGIADVVARRTPFYAQETLVELPGIGRKTLSLSGRPIVWGGGARMTLIAVDDISSIRALEHERAQLLDSEKQARIEAERANRAKDIFLATLSHELRTPLNIILLEAQLLGRLGGENRTFGRASTTIERAARTQARLIDDLLDVSRIVAGKLLLDLRVCELKEIVQSAVDMAMIAAEAKGVELRLSVDDDFLAPIYGDAMRLHQVVTNLLSNAIKFTPRGGRISVRLDRTDERAEIAITDTGIGIRADVLPQLFSRFVQGDSSVTRVHGGLGLGLAIVRHLVEAHGGEVHAESAGERMGTTLRVSLPIGAAGLHGTTDDALATIAHEIRGVRVLIVEDDDDARRSFSAMLELLGAVVSAAPSAAAGLAVIDEFRPQVILSDIAMPEEDGYSFIRKVRRLAPEHGGLVPAGALTALAGDDDRKQAKEAGFQLHIAKPVEAVHLAAAVRTLAAMTLRA